MYLLPRDTQRNLHFYAPFASPARRSGSGSEGLPPFLCIWEMLDVNDWVTAEYAYFKAPEECPFLKKL